MFREIYNYAKRLVGNSSSGDNVQLLLDKAKVKMSKTRPYLVTDGLTIEKYNYHRDPDVMTWVYKFKFDNISRKRRFLDAVKKYPPQPWDRQVRWLDELNTIKNDQGDPEFTIEVQCFVPPDNVGQFCAIFESFVAKKLILVDSGGEED